MGQTSPVVALIAQMITPAIFILATGNLVNSAMQRIVRVVDRARELITRANELHAKGDNDAYAFVCTELQNYRTRAGWIERSLSLYYFAIGLFVLASLSIPLNVVTGDHLQWAATILTVLGAIALLGGSFAFFIETRLATGLLRREIDREVGEC